MYQWKRDVRKKKQKINTFTETNTINKKHSKNVLEMYLNKKMFIFF